MHKTLPKALGISVVILLNSLLLILYSPLARADYQKAYSDLVYNYSQYRNAYNAFLVARSTYQTYKTLTAQNDAAVALRALLRIRNQVVSVYYDLLQEKLNITPQITDDTKTTFSNIKTSEKNWLAANQAKIDAAATVDDLNSVSGEFDGRYNQMSSETKNTVSQILLAKETLLKSQVDDVTASVSAKIQQMRSSGEDTSLLDRELISAQNKLDLYSQKITEAQKAFAANDNQGLTNGRQKLTEANQYLRETINYLTEIIRTIMGG